MATTTTTIQAPHSTVAPHASSSSASTTSEPPVQQAPEPGKDPSKMSYLKLMSASFCFFIGGVNIGSLGAIVPYIIRDYHVSTAIISSVYGATFAGWVVAAVTNTHLCQYLDVGLVLILGTSIQLIAHVLRVWLPPFGLFVVTFFLAALGQAYNDAQTNAFMSAHKGAHRWLAVVHASFMGGCLVGPFVATAVATATAKGVVPGTTPSPLSTRWYLFYTFPVGLSVLSLVIISWAFRDRLALKTKSDIQAANSAEQGETHDDTQASRSKNASSLIKAALSRPSVWLLSMFYFFYLGSQITLNGWVVEYLVEVREGDLAKMGFVPAGFNGGCMLGRLLLAEPTYRLGERRMVMAYCCLSIALQLVFWLVPNIIAASIAISFIGFFLGPLFATGVSLSSKLFPPDIHATSLVFVLAVAQLGASLFPSITGIIASRAGVHVLQPILVALLTATGVSWMLVPRPKAAANTALHEE